MTTFYRYTIISTVLVEVVMWDKYKDIFIKYGLCRFEGVVVWYDAVNSPYINSNRISSVLMQFFSNKETDISWIWEETSLAITILETEIQEVEVALGCKITLVVGNRSFTQLDGVLLEFIFKNKITSLTMVSDLDTRDFFASYIRYIRELDGSVNMDKVYIESIRDVRK